MRTERGAHRSGASDSHKAEHGDLQEALRVLVVVDERGAVVGQMEGDGPCGGVTAREKKLP